MNYSEFEPQLSPMEPISNELDEQESIHSQEETDSISSSSQISNTDTVLSQDDSDEINEDSEYESFHSCVILIVFKVKFLLLLQIIMTKLPRWI